MLAVALAIANSLTGDDVILIALLAFPPLIAASRSSAAATASVGVLCILLAVAAAWDIGFDQQNYPVRLTTVALGAIAGVWIAHLRESVRREHAAADLLAETGLLLQESLDSHDRAGQVARIAVPDLADIATVDLLDTHGNIVRMAAAGDDAGLADESIALRARVPVDPRGGHPAALAIRTGQVQLFKNLDQTARERFAASDAEREFVTKAKPAAVMAIPLRARGTMLGVLSLWILDPRRRHDRRAQNAALRLAHRVALALDNARLHDEQTHIATVLQGSLRPRSLPRIEGFQAAARFEAAGEAHLVGGDFYDAFVDEGGDWSVVIGDVCGKGPEAAALTALARYTVRAVSGPDTPPSQVLRSLHQSIHGEPGDTRFCTAALARVHALGGPGDGARVTLSLGGHPHPMVVRRDGSVENVGETGTLLGMLPSPTLSDAETQLAPGESLVLYTDGLLESRDRSEAEDPAWLAEELSSLEGAGAEAMAERVTATAIERQGGAPRDDIAVIVLRREGRDD